MYNDRRGFYCRRWTVYSLVLDRSTIAAAGRASDEHLGVLLRSVCDDVWDALERKGI